MNVRLDNTDLIVDTELDENDESTGDIYGVYNLDGTVPKLTESDLNAIADDLLRGKYHY